MITQGMNNTGLQRLSTPVRCDIGSELEGVEQCGNLAYWALNGFPLCQEDLKSMAVMNSDNYEAVKEALDNPLCVIVITNSQSITCAACEKRIATAWVVNMEDGKEVQHPRCDACKVRQLEVV